MNDTWQTAPDDLEISPHHVDIWLISTELGEEQVQAYRQCLTQAELARAQKFKPVSKLQGIYRDPRAAQAGAVQGIRVGHGRD